MSSKCMSERQIIEEGLNSGDGALHPNKSDKIKGFELSDTQRQQLQSFLFALTDHRLLSAEVH